MQISSLIGHTQELLGIILNSKKPADALIDTFFRSHKYLGSHDRKFIAETTYGTLRHLRKCELIVTSAMAELDETLFEEDKILFLVVAYLSLQGKMQGVIPEAVSSKLKSVRLAEKTAHILQVFLKPVMVLKEPAHMRIGLEYSFPDWMVQKFNDQYGESEVEKICASLNEQAPITLRVNTLKATVEQCQAELSKQGIETTKTSLSPFGLNLAKRINVFSLSVFQDGWFEVQDEGSQLLPFLIDPKPNAKLLDVCAGAGGKTLEFAALMKNRGEIFATDINSYRLEELRKRTKRAGAQNVRVQEIQAIEDLHEQYSHFFDIVFVDAPCSGLGTIRRNPGMKWMVTEQTVNEVSDKQSSILHSSAQLVKPGGRIVYATCTLLRQENEGVVEEFMVRHPEFKLIDANEVLEKWNNGLMTTDPFFKLLPHVHGTDGFFCAVLERQAVR
ncbi:MAG: 16S rRNA (cytosine(967)-C(5))-methyltransferase RsmB [Ignavibacteriales bacterium]|nr:16S rRNA (cytosine(967)-C(5))-methyltransferase RsmB [Ignavibacteriales bacterium]